MEYNQQMAYVLAGIVGVAMVLMALLVQRVLQQSDRVERASDQLVERLLATLAEPIRQPDPIIVPAPDLTQYLAQLARMSAETAREMGQAISLVVQGPPSPVTAMTSEAAPDEPEVAKEDIWYPPWESDQSWGIPEDAPNDGEWTATMAPVGNGNEPWVPFGSGGIHLPDNNGL